MNLRVNIGRYLSKISVRLAPLIVNIQRQFATLA